MSLDKAFCVFVSMGFQVYRHGCELLWGSIHRCSPSLMPQSQRGAISLREGLDAGDKRLDNFLQESRFYILSCIPRKPKKQTGYRDTWSP